MKEYWVKHRTWPSPVLALSLSRNATLSERKRSVAWQREGQNWTRPGREQNLERLVRFFFSWLALHDFFFSQILLCRNYFWVIAQYNAIMVHPKERGRVKGLVLLMPIYGVWERDWVLFLSNSTPDVRNITRSEKWHVFVMLLVIKLSLWWKYFNYYSLCLLQTTYTDKGEKVRYVIFARSRM